MHRLRTIWLAAFLTLGVALLIHPAIAWAHAHLTKSEPGAKATLATAPHEIRLWFSEQPELALTTITLADSQGVAIALGAVERDKDSTMVVRAPITGVVAPGLYTVRWRTAAADGHPSSGKFTFRVAAEVATPAPVVAESIVPPVIAPPPVVAPATPKPQASSAEDKNADALTPTFIATRALSFGALLAMIGAVAFRFFVLPRASNLDGSTHGQVTQRIARLGAVASVLFVLAAIVRLYLENRMMSGSAAMDIAHLRTMTMSTNWGAAWRAQVIAGVVAFAAFVLARRMPALGWALAGLASLVLAFATSLGGHAGSSEHFRTLSLVDDTIHILGASGWMGSLLCLVFAIGGTARTSAGGRASRVAALVNAFSPVALSFATLIAISGVVSAWLRLGELSALWTTVYGQVLLAKLALLVLLAASGYHNWRRVRPAVGGRDEATARLRRSANLELTLGLLVVVATAILVATPTPLAP